MGTIILDAAYNPVQIQIFKALHKKIEKLKEQNLRKMKNNTICKVLKMTLLLCHAKSPYTCNTDNQKPNDPRTAIAENRKWARSSTNPKTLASIAWGQRTVECCIYQYVVNESQRKKENDFWDWISMTNRQIDKIEITQSLSGVKPKPAVKFLKSNQNGYGCQNLDRLSQNYSKT